MENEIWKSIHYIKDYEISNLGRIKSFRRSKEKILKNTLHKSGYYCVTLNGKNYKVHQLVAMAFLNHIPCKYEFVIDHINNIRTDNRLSNLQIVTSRYNCSKRIIIKTSKFVGVSWCKEREKWGSYIRINNKTVNLGRYNNEEEANNAYLNKLKELQHEKGKANQK